MGISVLRCGSVGWLRRPCELDSHCQALSHALRRSARARRRCPLAWCLAGTPTARRAGRQVGSACSRRMRRGWVGPREDTREVAWLVVRAVTSTDRRTSDAAFDLAVSVLDDFAVEEHYVGGVDASGYVVGERTAARRASISVRSSFSPDDVIVSAILFGTDRKRDL